METCGHSDSSCGKLSKGENNNDNNKLFTDINITLYILSYNLVKEVCSACLQGNYFGIKINLMYHVFFFQYSGIQKSSPEDQIEF